MVKIGIDASRAFMKKRTGTEEYSFQVINYLREELKNEEVVLYLRPANVSPEKIGFQLPQNWRVKKLNWLRMWTQIGLSLEMMMHPIETLFIPAHTVPLLYAKKSVVVVHGLEYEFIPKAYSFLSRLHLRWSTKRSCKHAKKIITVSESTKRDLVKIYKTPNKKIQVIYEGYNKTKIGPSKKIREVSSKFGIGKFKYLLFIGRIEFRKNTLGIIKSFEILKDKYNIDHKLVLIGGLGYGYEDVIKKADASKYRNDIILTGYVNEEDKWSLLKNSDVFLFPTFYEGFGLPVLEAQSIGVPVVVSNISSIPEIVGEYMRSMLVDPNDYEKIADFTYKIIVDKKFRSNIKKAGRENVKRFSWDLCAEKIAKILLEK